MYREPEAAGVVPCSSCKAPTRKEDSVFSANGDILCLRCHGFEGAHAQVERARQAQIEEATNQRGIVGGILGVIEAARADDEALQHHAELANIERRPIAAPDAVHCQGCNTSMKPSEGVYTSSGALLCRPCSVRAEEHLKAIQKKSANQTKIVALVALAIIVLVGGTLAILAILH
jgi:recombinational DNA repair protein (RecF pathway)